MLARNRGFPVDAVNFGSLPVNFGSRMPQTGQSCSTTSLDRRGRGGVSWCQIKEGFEITPRAGPVRRDMVPLLRPVEGVRRFP